MQLLLSAQWICCEIHTNTSHSRNFAFALVSKRNPRKSLFVFCACSDLVFVWPCWILNSQKWRSRSPKYILLLKSYWVKQFSSALHCSQKKPTLFESENERQKIEPVPISIPRASRNFPDVKTRNDFFFHNLTSEIIPFISFGMQMDRT